MSTPMSPVSRRSQQQRARLVRAAVPWLLAAAVPAGVALALPADAATTTPAKASTAAPAPAVAVHHDGTHWVLQARHADPAAVWQALAAASGSTLWAPVRTESPPLTLHWRGKRLPEAWQRVLGHDHGHALQCGRRSCRVWVLGPAAPAAVPAATPPHPDPGDLRLPDPPGLFPDRSR